MKLRIALLCSLLCASGLPAQRATLPRVVVLATGGTIASRVDPSTGALAPARTGADLVKAVPGLDTIARVESEQVANVGSSDMTPEIWRALSTRANELLADPTITGVVVTHGTDTLEETAYFLDLTITSSKPVVLVGAQRAASFFDSDGPRNLLNAVRVVTSLEAVDKGVMGVMNGQINAAREVTKTNTIEAETFKTLEFGALGVADLSAVRFYRAPLRRQTIPLSAAQTLGRVEIVTQYAGADGRVIRLLLQENDLQGLVVEGFGLGHVTGGTLEAIKQARARQIPVVLASRVYTGRLIPLYARDTEATALGVIRADNLSAQKARVLLMLALTRTKDVIELQKIFDR
ncbi:MAG: asparaginase [Longimicrobiales bacterium]